MKTSAQLTLPIWNESTSSALAHPAKTSLPLARELALVVLRAAFSTTAFEWFQKRSQSGSSSKTLLRALLDGSTLSGANWNNLGMRRYRALCRRAGSELGRSVREYSSLPSEMLLPTLTETANLDSPSMQKWPRHQLLPALTAAQYGSNRGGSRENGAKQTKPHGNCCPLSPREITRGQDRNIAGGGVDLPRTIGGHLEPTWCEWFQGVNEGWTELDRESLRLVMRQRRSSAKSSATSSASLPDSETSSDETANNRVRGEE